jgi:hypothetical protein
VATEPNLTGEQRANLAKLADYLAALPADYEQFDMSSFYEDAGSGCGIPLSRGDKPKCGTVACAAGHGIAAGIPARDTDLDMWCFYSQRAFCPEGEAWDWCFEAEWSDVDNTPAGAAARIRLMLKHGVPENYYAQMHGRAPLSYAVVTAA